MERAKAVDELAARCEAEPGVVMTDLLGRLATRTDELARALQGESLRVELLLTGWTELEVWMVFSPLGHVAAVTDRALLGCDARPHVLLRGAPEDVLRVVLGLVRMEDAVAGGVFIPLVPVARFRRLLWLVGRELLAAADDGDDPG